MNKDQDKAFLAIEEIIIFKKLLAEVKPDLKQTLTQLIQHEKEIYRNQFSKSTEENKLPDNPCKDIPIMESKSPILEVSSQLKTKFRAHFLIQDPKLRGHIKKLLPEDLVYLESLNELGSDQHIVLLSLSAERLISDELQNKICTKMSKGTLHMITFCPKGLQALDATFSIGNKRVETYVFGFDGEYKCLPRKDNKTILQILEIAGYQKRKILQANPEDEPLPEEQIKNKKGSGLESKDIRQPEVHKGSKESELYKRSDADNISGMHNKSIGHQAKPEEEPNRVNQHNQQKTEKKIDNTISVPDTKKGFFYFF